VPSVSDIEQLLPLIELTDVVFHEERSRRIVWADDNPKLEDLPNYSNALGVMHGDEALTFRFRMVYTDRDAEYAVDISTVYTLTEPIVCATEILREFSERVAFMAAYPFLRSSIYGSAARLGQPIPVLGLIRAGEFEISPPEDDEDIAAAFRDTASERSDSHS
jgi:hypothetical protein